MDNNFNQQAPQQPVYQQVPKQPSNNNVMSMIALICSGVGALLAVLGSILTCSCSASKTYDAERMAESAMGMLGSILGGGSSSASLDMHATSAVLILALVGAIVAAAGVVLAIIELKKNKANKMAYIAVAVGAFGVMYGVLPVLTICGYNCSLNSASEEAGLSMFK